MRLEYHWEQKLAKDIFEKALPAAKENGKIDSQFQVIFENLDEGSSVQMLHLGPYDDEKESIDSIMIL